MDRNADYIRALEEELAGYERVGRKDRAADVKAELKRVAAAKVEPVEEEPAEPGPISAGRADATAKADEETLVESPPKAPAKRAPGRRRSPKAKG